MKTLTIASSKGGSGKTTVAGSLAARIAPDQRVALLDADSGQASLTMWWTCRGEPGNPALFEATDSLAGALDAIRRQAFDWLLIDTPPSNLDVVEQCIAKSDAVLIPVRPSLFDVSATDAITEMCQTRRRPFAYVLTDVDVRFGKLAGTALVELARHGQVLATRVSHRLAYVNAVTVGKSGPEIDSSLAAEIEALWLDVQRLAGPAKPAVRAVA